MGRQEHEAELIRQAIAGERGALFKLLGRSRQSLCAHIANKIPATLRAVLDGEDIVQETHVEVFRNIATFESRAPESFAGWVRTIATRKLRDALRRQRAAKRGGGKAAVGALPAGVADSVVALLDLVSGPEKTASRVVARAEAIAAMQAAMAQLPEDYRRAIWLVHIEGWTAAEVAQEMGRSEGAIRVLCHTARKRLRELLGSRSSFLSSSG